MTLYSRAIVFYQRTAQAEQAYDLAERLKDAGIEAEVKVGPGQGVELYGRFTRDIQFLSWDEAKGLGKVKHDGPVLQVKRLNENAKLPTRGSPQSAGLDLYYDGSAGTITLWPGDRYAFTTGISIAPPAGTYARVAPRSGLAMKGVDVLAGVVDADYRGEVKVLLVLQGKQADVFGSTITQERVTIQPGDKIAQIVLERCVLADPVDVDDLDETVRGQGGFGSTGA